MGVQYEDLSLSEQSKIISRQLFPQLPYSITTIYWLHPHFYSCDPIGDPPFRFLVASLYCRSSAHGYHANLLKCSFLSVTNLRIFSGPLECVKSNSGRLPCLNTFMVLIQNISFTSSLFGFTPAILHIQSATFLFFCTLYLQILNP